MSQFTENRLDLAAIGPGKTSFEGISPVDILCLKNGYKVMQFGLSLCNQLLFEGRLQSHV